MYDFLGRKKIQELEGELRASLARADTLLKEREHFKVQAEQFEALLKREEFSKVHSGTACVEAIMKRGIDWYNVEKMDFAGRVQYFLSASQLAKNEVLLNEIHHLEADWVQWIATKTKDYAEVRDMRMCINALELLLERLTAIEDPRKKESTEDLHSPI